ALARDRGDREDEVPTLTDAPTFAGARAPMFAVSTPLKALSIAVTAAVLTTLETANEASAG
ncbi:MAG: hypothetical protein ABI899_11470, partial [Actinomycetota bacterium]